jgi:uncharacterized protein (DUF488 family)
MIYTWGYWGKDVSEAARILDEIGGVLIDARLKPVSRYDPQWYRKNLENYFGKAYLSLTEWGNLNYKNDLAPKGIFMIADFRAGLEKLPDGRSALVMCVCKNYHTCHRSELARLLQLQGLDTEEWQDD